MLVTCPHCQTHQAGTVVGPDDSAWECRSCKGKFAVSFKPIETRMACTLIGSVACIEAIVLWIGLTSLLPIRNAALAIFGHLNSPTMEAFCSVSIGFFHSVLVGGGILGLVWIYRQILKTLHRAKSMVILPEADERPEADLFC